jgi:hypothetical protein
VFCFDAFSSREPVPTSLENALLDELDAERLSATPDDFAIASRPCIARERQPQLAGQKAGITNRDLGTRGRQILHHARPRREAAVKRDPSGLVKRFARFPLLGCSGHFNCS